MDGNVAHGVETSEHDLGCAYGVDDRQSDLCAQWKAADAAKSSAAAAWVFGFAGAAIGLVTMIAAILAARYAKKAARHTEEGANESKRAADAAESALDQNKEFYTAELRPWLEFSVVVEHAKVTDYSLEFTVTVKTTNLGKTPARNLAFDLTTRNAETGSMLELEVPEFEKWPDFGVLSDVVFPAQEQSVSIVQSFQRPLWHTTKFYGEETEFLRPKLIVICSYSWPGYRGKTAKVFWLHTFAKAEDGYQTAINVSQQGPVELQAMGIGPKLYE